MQNAPATDSAGHSHRDNTTDPTKFASRERVNTSLAHQQPDRVPVDFGGHRSSGIAAIAYAKLRRHLTLPDQPIRVYDMPQQLAVIDDDVLDRSASMPSRWDAVSPSKTKTGRSGCCPTVPGAGMEQAGAG